MPKNGEGCSGGGSKGGETCLTEQVRLKPPETTLSNHRRAFNAAVKPLTSTKKQESSPHFRRKIKANGARALPLRK